MHSSSSQAGRVGAEPARQHVALPDLRGQRDALQRDQRLAQAVGAGAGAAVGVDVLPAREEAGELGAVGGLDLAPQDGEAGAPHPAQHFGVAPLALGPARQQLAADQRPFAPPARAAPAPGRPRSGRRAGRSGRGRGCGRSGGPGRASRRGGPRGRPRAGPRAAARRARRGRGRRPRRRCSAPRRRSGPWRRGARRPASPASTRPSSPRRPARRTPRAVRSPRLRSTCWSASRSPARPRLGAVLELRLDLLQRLGVDQLAQLLLAEQLAQQVAVEGQRRRAPLGVGRVPLVHVGGDVVEEQRGGEGRGGRGLDLDQAEPARVEVAEDLAERGQVEHVAQALAVGLEDDREAGEVPRHLEQALRLQPLLPERGALAGVGAGDEQRAGGVLAEAGAEQGRVRELAARPGPRARRARS